jgi:hypothetical protein
MRGCAVLFFLQVICWSSCVAVNWSFPFLLVLSRAGSLDQWNSFFDVMVDVLHEFFSLVLRELAPPPMRDSATISVVDGLAQLQSWREAASFWTHVPPYDDACFFTGYGASLTDAAHEPSEAARARLASPSNGVGVGGAVGEAGGVGSFLTTIAFLWQAFQIAIALSTLGASLLVQGANYLAMHDAYGLRRQALHEPIPRWDRLNNPGAEARSDGISLKYSHALERKLKFLILCADCERHGNSCFVAAPFHDRIAGVVPLLMFLAYFEGMA